MKNQMDRLSLNSIFGMIVLFWAITGLFAGCSSSPKRVKVARETVREALELQKHVEIKNSERDGRPAWTKKTVFEDEGNIYFSGGFLNGSDYAITIRCANAEALKVAMQSVSQFVRTEFSEYAEGSNTGADGIDRFVRDGIAVFVENMQLQGIRQKEVYYEETFSPSVMQPTFNVFVMLEMPKADYLKAKADVILNLRDRFSSEGRAEAKKRADMLLDQLKRDVEKEAGHES